ncbi:MAG: radical SAM protein [Defluviitaleaceae bacterium]|nr:radical SAM protein [Defluviitaleaceae bacterium]
MHLTLHVTNRCNLACKYCFVELGPARMSKEVAFAAVDFATQYKATTGLLFYGGEPLLERQLIFDTVDYTKTIKDKTGHSFLYKMTTNGMLLDEEFLKFAQWINLTIGFSHDGPAQDDCRLTPDGKATFAHLEETIPLLLKYQPYAIGMSVLDPSVVHKSADIVKFLFDKGFRYITHNLNYGGDWTSEHLAILEQEYKKMADMYIKWTKAEIKFYLSPIDIKIVSHIKGDRYISDRRQMARNQLSVAPDGMLYSSSRFVGTPELAIGDVFTGIDAKRQKYLSKKGAELLDACKGCALVDRCNYSYDSLSWDGEGVFTNIPAIGCAHEQMLTPIADGVAEKLFKEQNALFIHKHYNDMYPVVSLVEDRSR